MLAKKHRLSKTKDIQKTFLRGRGFFYPFFGIKFVAHEAPAKVTVVVSTKISKKAVQRNRIKRVIREMVRTHITALKPGDYMIMARPGLEKEDNANIREKFLKVLKTAKLLV